jgi:hypothetical protein
VQDIVNHSPPISPNSSIGDLGNGTRGDGLAFEFEGELREHPGSYGGQESVQEIGDVRQIVRIDAEFKPLEDQIVAQVHGIPYWRTKRSVQ